jgi:hypothetical protein
MYVCIKAASYIHYTHLRHYGNALMATDKWWLAVVFTVDPAQPDAVDICRSYWSNLDLHQHLTPLQLSRQRLGNHFNLIL